MEWFECGSHHIPKWKTKRPNQEPQMHLQISSRSPGSLMFSQVVAKSPENGNLLTNNKKKRKANGSQINIFHTCSISNWWKPTGENQHFPIFEKKHPTVFSCCQRSFPAPHGTPEPSFGTQSLEVPSPRLKHALNKHPGKKGQDLEKKWWITYNLVVDFFLWRSFWRSEFPCKNVTKCLKLPNMLWNMGSFFLVEKELTEKSNSCLPGTAFAHAHAARVDPPFPTPDSTMTCAPEVQDQRILHLFLGGWWFAIPGMLQVRIPSWFVGHPI